MKLTGRLTVKRVGDTQIALVGPNGDEIAYLQTHGGENLTIEEYHRIDAALLALINREGLEV